MKIIIFAALRQEVKYILRQLGARKAVRGGRGGGGGLAGGREMYSAFAGGKDITIALTGMGMKNAGLCVNDLLSAQRADLVLSVGLAGALYPGAEYGDIVCPERALLHPGGESIYAGGPGFEKLYPAVSEKTAARRGLIVTLSNWVEKEKTALKIFTSGNDNLPENRCLCVCDMETFPIARAALKGGFAFFGIRAVSDRADEEINFDPMDIADAGGQVSARRAVLKFAANPRLIPAAARLRKNSETASLRLALALNALLDSALLKSL
ncbi:MAG: hypothetical protein M0033_10780 [Nitrospiraceae bacterium]|nr:hypothetical protein [Nitrospiraceae bacterium]